MISIGQTNLRQLKKKINSIVADSGWSISVSKEDKDLPVNCCNYKGTILLTKKEMHVEFFVQLLDNLDSLNTKIIKYRSTLTCIFLNIENLKSQYVFFSKYVLFLPNKCIRNYKDEEIELIKFLIERGDKQRVIKQD